MVGRPRERLGDLEVRQARDERADVDERVEARAAVGGRDELEHLLRVPILLELGGADDLVARERVDDRAFGARLELALAEVARQQVGGRACEWQVGQGGIR